MCSVSRYTGVQWCMYISLNKKHSVVFIYGSIYVEEDSRYRWAERRVQSSYQRKVVVLRRLTVRLSLPLSLPSFPSLFLFVRSPLNTRFPAIAISAWCTYMHTYAYLYIFTHSPIPESWPMVIDTECRSFAMSWNDYYVLFSLVFSLLFSYLLPFLCNFTHFILHRERISLCIFDLSLALLLSPSFAAVTIFLPDTRGIIRTDSLLAWRFVGEVYFLRCTRSFSSFLFVSCTVG